ncbi:MAG: hypothetical protein ACODAJ_13955, partial [Planctomycetota bacterium]
RGLVTPFYDGWSLDAWVLTDSGAGLLPSAAERAEQRLRLEPDDLAVETFVENTGSALAATVRVTADGEGAAAELAWTARASEPAWLAITLRPFNPEGVSFVETLELGEDHRTWRVNGSPSVVFESPVESHRTATYREGDVHHRLLARPASTACVCEAGLATGAALFRLAAGEARRVTARVDLSQDKESSPALARAGAEGWADALDGAARLAVPDERFQFLYDAALRTLVLMSPDEAWPGPFTYKRFWFRDATFIVHALLCAGLTDRAGRALERFGDRQRVDGYFHSQDGEWDSNGQVLWLLRRYRELSDRGLQAPWPSRLRRGARWIERKLCKADSEALHAGLLPAGFSAEHLGNNDFYYWDDFWAAAGLRAAAALCAEGGRERDAERFAEAADAVLAAIDRSLERSRDIRRHPGIPASPYRRMDAGAVGSLAAGYPLQLWAADDPRLLATARFLMDDCLVRGAFFQDMIHSGLNAYLTLHLAQVLLRAGDPACLDLIDTVADLASPTGQWPEAIHPRTGGGCMGDGQHAWAAAEWVMMLRHLFLREEGEALVVGAGIPSKWLQPGAPLRFGPAPTPHGPVDITIEPQDGQATVTWDAAWRAGPPTIDLRLPGLEPQRVDATPHSHVTLSRRE